MPERQAGTVTRMSEPLKLTVVYEDGEDGWIMAQVAEAPAAVSQGRTREEAGANVLDALRLVLAPEQAVPADRSEALEFTLRSSADELVARTGGRRLTPEEFEREFGDLPSDAEG